MRPRAIGAFYALRPVTEPFAGKLRVASSRIRIDPYQGKDVLDALKTAINLRLWSVCHWSKSFRPQAQMPIGLRMRPFQECHRMNKGLDRLGGKLRR